IGLRALDQPPRRGELLGAGHPRDVGREQPVELPDVLPLGHCHRQRPPVLSCAGSRNDGAIPGHDAITGRRDAQSARGNSRLTPVGGRAYRPRRLAIFQEPPMPVKPFKPQYMKIGVLTAALQELTPRSGRDPDPDKAIEEWVAFARELGADHIQLSAAPHPSEADVPAEAMLDPVANTLDLRKPFDKDRARRVHAA